MSVRYINMTGTIGFEYVSIILKTEIQIFSFQNSRLEIEYTSSNLISMKIHEIHRFKFNVVIIFKICEVWINRTLENHIQFVNLTYLLSSYTIVLHSYVSWRNGQNLIISYIIYVIPVIHLHNIRVYIGYFLTPQKSKIVCKHLCRIILILPMGKNDRFKIFTSKCSKFARNFIFSGQ